VTTTHPIGAGRQPGVVARFRVDVKLADRVAGAFIAAPRCQRGSVVERAYADLDHQAHRWFRLLTGDGCRRPTRVVFTNSPEPYACADDLSASVRDDRLLEMWPTQRDHDRRHPRLDTSVGGAYDRFRAVHDIVSHGWLRHAFDRDGEFSAWLAEDRIYTGIARWALATELHGTHSATWTPDRQVDHKAALLDRSLIAESQRAARLAT